jgi:hypothetical protein
LQPPETNASALPGATKLYPRQRAIVDAIAIPRKRAPFYLASLSFAQSLMQAARCFLYNSNQRT